MLTNAEITRKIAVLVADSELTWTPNVFGT